MQNDVLFTLYKNGKSDGLYVYRNNILYKYNINNVWEESKDNIDTNSIQIKGFILNKEQVKRLYIIYIKGYDYVSFNTDSINKVTFLSNNYTEKDSKIIITNFNKELFPYTKIDGINQTVIIDLKTLLEINHIYEYINKMEDFLEMARKVYRKIKNEKLYERDDK